MADRRSARESTGVVQEEGHEPTSLIVVGQIGAALRLVRKPREVAHAAPVDPAEGLADEQEERVELDVDAVVVGAAAGCDMPDASGVWAK